MKPISHQVWYEVQVGSWQGVADKFGYPNCTIIWNQIVGGIGYTIHESQLLIKEQMQNETN